MLTSMSYKTCRLGNCDENDDISNLFTLNALREKKKSIDDWLRQFERDFYAKHNRAPLKADKEAMSSLYNE